MGGVLRNSIFVLQNGGDVMIQWVDALLQGGVGVLLMQRMYLMSVEVKTHSVVVKSS